jgi:hypothetical protein
VGKYHNIDKRAKKGGGNKFENEVLGADIFIALQPRNVILGQGL